METYYSILGVLFFEALRIYRCYVNSESIVPNVGVSPAVATSVYALIMVVFAVVAFCLSSVIGDGTEVEAFLFGFSVPSGSTLLKPNASGGGDEVEDLESEVRRPLATAKAWIDRYYA